jgi:hypothetical protein
MFTRRSAISYRIEYLTKIFEKSWKLMLSIIHYFCDLSACYDCVLVFIMFRWKNLSMTIKNRRQISVIVGRSKKIWLVLFWSIFFCSWNLLHKFQARKSKVNEKNRWAIQFNNKIIDIFVSISHLADLSKVKLSKSRCHKKLSTICGNRRYF